MWLGTECNIVISDPASVEASLSFSSSRHIFCFKEMKFCLNKNFLLCPLMVFLSFMSMFFRKF